MYFFYLKGYFLIRFIKGYFQLRTELRGLQTDADGVGIAIVMGPAVLDGMQSPANLQHRIKADAPLGGVTIEQNDICNLRSIGRGNLERPTHGCVCSMTFQRA